MDLVVAGLTKLHCVCKSADNGKTAKVTYGGRTYEKTVASGSADFILPPYPSPERDINVNVSLWNGNSQVYSRNIQVGFGDNIVVGLHRDYEPATKADINQVESDLTALETRVNSRISYGTSDKVDGSSYLASGTIYCYYGS
jgi:hypothetical protein